MIALVSSCVIDTCPCLQQLLQPCLEEIHVPPLIFIPNCYPIYLTMNIHTLSKPDFYKIIKYVQKPLKRPKYPQNL